MKKFTLFAIAALFSVVAFAQKANKQANQLASVARIALQNPVRAQQIPAGLSLQSNMQKFSSRRAQRRAVTSADDLVGTKMILNTYYTYSEEAGLQFDAPAYAGNSVEIVKNEDGSLSIVNFLSGSDQSITIVPDFENGTFTIPNGQVAYVHEEVGDCILKNMMADGDLTGTIYDDALVINEIYAIVVASGNYAGARLTPYTSSVITSANGKMAWIDSDGEAKDIDVYLLANDETHVVTVYNFADWETAVDIQLMEEQTFVIKPQLIYSSSSNGDYYTCSAIPDSYNIGSEEITGTGTANTLTSDTNFTCYNGGKSWFGNQGAFTITAVGLEFVYPVIPDVAAMPATPEVVDISEYNADNGYGAVILDIPTTDADGNLIKTSKLFYQLYSDINGVIAPITFTTDLYKNIEADMTEIPYTLNDDYDFDTTDGYKRVWLNFDYSNYTRIGVKSIYKGGDAVNETEIQWIECQPLFAWHHASSELLNEIRAANELSKTDGWTNGAEEFTAAIDAAIAAYLDEDATVESMTAALEALKQAEEEFTAANAGVASATWVAKDQEYTNGQELGEFQIDDFLIGKFEAGSYSTSAKFYTSGNAVRFYAGNTLTITGNSGVKKITQIIINVSGKGYNKPMTVDTGEYTDNATDFSGVWQGEATSVTFTNAATAQARILSIEIKYELSDEAVGISTVQTVTIPVDGIYNLQGQRLSEKPQKGLYIMGGKKYVVK